MLLDCSKHAEVEDFMARVNRALLELELSEESIDISMAIRYINEGFTVTDAINDICDTLEILW